jgi:hypothetical protein
MTVVIHGPEVAIAANPALVCFASPHTEGMCPLLIGLRPPPGYCFSSGARLARDPNGLPSTGTPVRLGRFPAL